MAGSVSSAAPLDPCTKTVEGIPDLAQERAQAALGRRIIAAPGIGKDKTWSSALLPALRNPQPSFRCIPLVANAAIDESRAGNCLKAKLQTADVGSESEAGIGRTDPTGLC